MESTYEELLERLEDADDVRAFDAGMARLEGDELLSINELRSALEAGWATKAPQRPDIPSSPYHWHARFRSDAVRRLHNVDGLVQFYEQITGLSVVRSIEDFAELKTPSCTLAIASTRTMEMFGAAAAHPADNHTRSNREEGEQRGVEEVARIVRVQPDMRPARRGGQIMTAVYFD